MEKTDIDLNGSEVIKKQNTKTISSGDSQKLNVQIGKNGRPIVKYSDLRAVRVDANGEQ